MKKPLLTVKNLTVCFSHQKERIKAVKDVSLTLFERESLGIVGESGSGKTSIIQAITKLSDASIEGDVFFEDTNLLQNRSKILGTKIGMIFQDPMASLNPIMKIGEQIAEGMIYHKLANRQVAKQKALQLLKLVGLSNEELRYHQYPHELSGGMRQRVAIAIALACNPQLLIGDEPTTALDVTIQAQILQLIKNIQKNFNMSLLLISHDLGVVYETCDRILILKDGMIVEEGETKTLFNSPKHPYTKMLINAWEHRSYSSTPPAPIHLQTNQAPLLEVKNLSKHFLLKDQIIHAAKSISFSLQKGEILGLVGESGSGKSTLGKMILRLITPSSGQIFFKQEEISNQKKRHLYRQIQMIFQDPASSLNPRMTIESILKEPTDIHHLPPRVDELLDLVGLPQSAKKRYPHEFSGGQKQRISIARALSLKPDLIVCDEPISSLDILIQTQIIHLLLKLQKELGLSLLFITHDLTTVLSIANRIAVMQKGEIVELKESKTLKENPEHPYTKHLLSSIPKIEKKVYLTL